MSAPQNGADVLARIKPQLKRERTQICPRPDLLEAWEAANEELVESRVADSGGEGHGRMADRADKVSAKTKRLAKKVQELEAAIEENSIWFEFEALPKDKFRELTDQHPPRKDHQLDQYLGWNREAVEDASVRACMIDPVFDDASWAELVKVLNPSEWAELRAAAERVNQAVTTPPKSPLASKVLAKPASTSK